MRSNKRELERQLTLYHLWSKEDGFVLDKKAVEEKSKKQEIVVIPRDCWINPDKKARP